jgi:hypothetical protein
MGVLSQHANLVRAAQTHVGCTEFAFFLQGAAFWDTLLEHLGWPDMLQCRPETFLGQRTAGEDYGDV